MTALGTCARIGHFGAKARDLILTEDTPTVLVVEDEPLIRMAAVDLVHDAGLKALEAANADHAIRILEARKDIRIVFTDVDMPGTMDGLKLAHHVRKRWPLILLIIASGKSILDEADLPSDVQLFPKPYEHERITATLINLASQVQ